MDPDRCLTVALSPRVSRRESTPCGIRIAADEETDRPSLDVLSGLTGFRGCQLMALAIIGLRFVGPTVLVAQEDLVNTHTG